MVSGSDPNAPVQWWNAKCMTVSCPYCEKTHRHGFPGDGDGRIQYDGIRRRSDCSPQAGGGEYTVVFPFDVVRNKAGYEINKQEGTFVSANFLAKQAGDANSGVASRPNDNELSRGAEAARQKRPQFSDGSTRTATMEFSGKQITFDICDVKETISACINGEVNRVEAYLNKFQGTGDYTIFLHGEGHDGNTALCLAAMEKTPGMVALLLKHGSDVNARNHEGRTPLMEAALWGRRENVRILLKHRADKTLRDQAGKLAIDLAKPSEANEEERYHRVKDYQEVMHLVRQDQRQIVCMLNDPLTQDQLFGFGASEDQGPRYDVQPGNLIALVTPIAQLADAGEQTEGWNHVALLDRGGQFPPVYASSRDIDRDNETMVGGRSLRQSVIKIASLVGHQLPPVRNQDHDESDQCSVDHAEKQLIAYFIDKHLFLPDDVVNENELDDLLRWRDEYGYGETDDEEDADEVRRIALTQLKRVQPPVCLKRATILSSTAVCSDCKEFCRRVNDHFGLELFLRSRVEEIWFIPREEVLFGDEISEGSFGKVYRGKWNGTKVVIKCVKIDGQSDVDKRKFLREMFVREVDIWEKARHPNIVRFCGACNVGLSWFIVSEYASGRTLPQYLHKHGRSLVWRQLHEVALGLLYLHKNGIIHSDIKSNNILVSKNGKAMLNDFGLSFEQSKSRLNVKKWGAVQWRPPEYVLENGAGPSFAGDVYSLGMCIVEAVTGRGSPWEPITDSQVKTFLQNKEMMPRPPEMSDTEWELVERMCAFEPSERMPLADVIVLLKDLADKEKEQERKNPALPSGRTPSSISRLPKYALGSKTMWSSNN